MALNHHVGKVIQVKFMGGVPGPTEMVPYHNRALPSIKESLQCHWHVREKLDTDTSRKGMWYASIPLVYGHSTLSFPVSDK